MPHDPIYGYFDDPTQSEPAYCPEPKRCAVCLKAFAGEPIKNISVMPVGESTRSYFFFFHAACWDALTPEQQQEIECAPFEEIANA